ncbi:MAG: hypothetical protein JO065_00840, partial [Acidobacteria bacterium]|nr:hypothetical protein [Acidobacteriota bacterium]
MSRNPNGAVSRLKTITALLASACLVTMATGFVPGKDADDFNSKTPIKHIVVIFQENVSFDHY